MKKHMRTKKMITATQLIILFVDNRVVLIKGVLYETWTCIASQHIIAAAVAQFICHTCTPNAWAWNIFVCRTYQCKGNQARCATSAMHHQ